MLRRRRIVPPIAVVTAALLTLTVLDAPGAGADEILDGAQLAKRVAATVRAAHPDLPVKRVRCRPASIEPRRASTARCTVTAGGYRLVMRVTVADRRGNVTIASTQAVIPTANAEYLVAANSTLPVTADCGSAPYIVRKPGESFTCTATFADGTQSQVTLTPTDVAGNASITAVT